MKMLRLLRPLGAAVLLILALGATAPAAQAEEKEPLFVFIPSPPPFASATALPPPIGVLDGPCGAAVNSEGDFYISDYYHDGVDVWHAESEQYQYYYEPEKQPPFGEQGYIGQYAPIDAIDGPCALALDAEDNLYVNDFHRRILKFAGPLSELTASGTPEPSVIAGQGVDSTHPTGVAVDPATGNVYVDARTYIAVYKADGTPVMDGLNPLRIGFGSLEDGYGVAFSSYPGTEGDIYVPDAASKTVKIFDPSVDKVNPVDEIDAGDTPSGSFVSLHDAAIAIDRASGEVYVVDDLQPLHTEKPEALIDVFDAAGSYEGHLLDRVDDALPVGLAVDNSSSPRFTGFTYLPPPYSEKSTIRVPNGTQGMVYVTSGNTTNAAVYDYAPGSATTQEASPTSFSVKVSVTGEGSGSVRSNLAQSGCASTCEESVPVGGQVVFTATPSSGSGFAGWTGACEGNAASCTITVQEAATVRARFEPVAGPPAGTASSGAAQVSQPSVAPSSASRPGPIRHARRHHRHRRHHKHGRHHRPQRS